MRSCFGCRIVIPERIADANPESRPSGFDAEPVIGPRFARTRWHRPGMTEANESSRRYADRTDRDPDGVAAGGTDGGDWEDPGVSAGGDDVSDRLARRIPDLDRTAERFSRAVAAAAGVAGRRRRAVRLSRAVFPGAALCASGRSRPVELSLAVADCIVLGAAARRTAGAAPCHRGA